MLGNQLFHLKNRIGITLLSIGSCSIWLIAKQTSPCVLVPLTTFIIDFLQKVQLLVGCIWWAIGHVKTRQPKPQNPVGVGSLQQIRDSKNPTRAQYWNCGWSRIHPKLKVFAWLNQKENISKYVGAQTIEVYRQNLLALLTEGSLEVKLPTIWTVEKQRWEESEEKRSEERRCRCAKR